MSICLAQDSIPIEWQIGALVGGLAMACIVGALAGVYRYRSVAGAQRLRPLQPLWPIVVAGLVGVVGWLGLQIVYGANKGIAFAREHPGVRFDLEKALNAKDYAFLATVPGVVGFCALVLMDRVLDRRLVGAIVPLPRRLSRGIVPGVVGTLIVFPLMMASSVALEQFYNVVGYQHPESHELLAAMKGAMNPVTKGLLIFGACVVAPMFEEFLFRGHLETFLARVFDPPRVAKVVNAPPALAGQESDVVALPAPEVLDYASGATEQRSPAKAWLAILVTSIFFAGVHPAWMAPLIFVLSLCLGYAYERTGNIWVSILIHGSFNTFNTIFFLKMMAV